MAKGKVEAEVVAGTPQAFEAAVSLDRAAKGAAQSSTKERNAATRGVFLTAVSVFATTPTWSADEAIRIYYEKPLKGTTLYNRRNEWNMIRDAARRNAGMAAQLWPTQEESEKAEVKNVTKEMFLKGCDLMNKQPTMTPAAILEAMRAAKAKVEQNEGDVMAAMDETIMALYTRFPATFAKYQEPLNAIRIAYHAERANGGHKTTVELAEAEAAKPAPVAELKVAA